MKQVILKKSKLICLAIMIFMALSLSVTFANSKSYEQQCLQTWSMTSAAQSCIHSQVVHDSLGAAYVKADCQLSHLPRYIPQKINCLTIMTHKKMLNCSGIVLWSNDPNFNCSE